MSTSARTVSCRTNAPPVLHVVRVEIRRNECGSTNRTEISSCASHCVPGSDVHVCRSRSQASHHRALHAGAVLGVVNALRFASTRPAAGPSGIDDASARHDLGYCAMAGFLMTRAGREKRVDAGFPQAYVDVIASVPHGTSSASHPVHAERVSSRRPQGTIQAHPPQHRVRLLRRHAARESAHLSSRSQRTLFDASSSRTTRR